MYVEQKIDRILELLEASRPSVSIEITTSEEILASAKLFPAELKVKLAEAMGFAQGKAPHEMGCVSIQGSGLICTCVEPEILWTNPDDVSEFLEDTFEIRKERTLERERKEEEAERERE